MVRSAAGPWSPLRWSLVAVSPLTNRFAVSDAFTPEQVAAVVTSADGWNAASFGRAKVSFAIVPEPRISNYNPERH